MAIVSVTANLLESKGKIDGKYYYGAPWEAEADALGGVLGNTFDQKRRVHQMNCTKNIWARRFLQR